MKNNRKALIIILSSLLSIIFFLIGVSHFQEDFIGRYAFFASSIISSAVGLALTRFTRFNKNFDQFIFHDDSIQKFKILNSLIPYQAEVEMELKESLLGGVKESLESKGHHLKSAIIFPWQRFIALFSIFFFFLGMSFYQSNLRYSLIILSLCLALLSIRIRKI